MAENKGPDSITLTYDLLKWSIPTLQKFPRDILEPIFDPAMIYDSYANRKDKGTHKAVDRFTQFRRKRRYVLKMDVKKRIGRLARAYSLYQIDLKEVRPSVMFWIGHVRHADSYNLRRKVLHAFPWNTRVANRNRNNPDNRNTNSGFRVASASIGRVRPGRAGIRVSTEAGSAASEAQVRSWPDLLMRLRPNTKPARRRPVGLARKLPPGLAKRAHPGRTSVRAHVCAPLVRLRAHTNREVQVLSRHSHSGLYPRETASPRGGV
ncbi:MAG: hypothetical protein AB1641_29445, partial [Thermodesulfobacteriota bacterium]